MPEFHVPTADQGSEPSGDSPPTKTYGRYSESTHKCLRCDEVFINGPLENGYYCKSCHEEMT